MSRPAFNRWVGTAGSTMYRCRRPTVRFGRDLNLRSQINVRNVFDDTGLIPVLAHTDGTILEYDLKALRVWMFTKTLRF